jgi:membrane protease YdiL (CAAX protease family)
MTASHISGNVAHADDPQYSLAKILAIWAAVALPMPVLVFFVAPALVSSLNTHPGLLIWYVGIAGMAWQFVVSMFLLYRELDEFTWSAIKTRIWLNKPSDPKTGRKSYKLFLWLIPAAIFVILIEVSPFGGFLDQILLTLFPALGDLEGTDIEALFVPELVGAWWLFGVAILNNVFNYFLGEELLFRGILLPKMRGVFGKWDWVANAALFSLYHLDKPQNIIKISISALAYTWTSKRFRSIWFAIILHGVEMIIVFGAVYMVVTGTGLE